ncbi:MAG TPA: ATP-dependent endonuclease [Chloroflexota bacterium]|nr:ATP-dependent endonuclease [Chloroflexota bacterium]
MGSSRRSICCRTTFWRTWRTKKSRSRRFCAPGGRGRFISGQSAAGGHAVVLVEGISDQIAVETLAARLGRNLKGEGVSVVPIGGAHAMGRALTRFGPQGANLRLAGLYDVGEETVVRRALQRAGFGSDLPLTRADMEEIGFYVCVLDLEDELIRALGANSVEAVIESQGELGSFRTLRKEPAWRGQRVEAQLRRFMGSGGTRKIRYAKLLVEALEPAEVPRPLRCVLAQV